MKNTILLLFFTLFSFHSIAQVVQTRVDSFKKIKWDSDDEEFYRSSENVLSEKSTSTIWLAYDKIMMTSNDTMTVFLNETPKEYEDSIIAQRTWNKAVNDHNIPMYVRLIYYKNEDRYLLMVVNPETDKGIEYYVTPINRLKPVGKKKK